MVVVLVGQTARRVLLSCAAKGSMMNKLQGTQQIDEREMIPAGSEEEVEIRACTIQAVELLKKQLQSAIASDSVLCSVALDWWLWAIGERDKDRQKPHHRTLTPYY